MSPAGEAPVVISMKWQGDRVLTQDVSKSGESGNEKRILIIL